MKIDLQKIQVINNPAAGRFEAWVNGYLAELVYHIDGRDMIITHTGVPVELGGQGLGSRLVRVALEYAQEHSYRVISFCSFVDGYIQQHPEAYIGEK